MTRLLIRLLRTIEFVFAVLLAPFVTALEPCGCRGDWTEAMADEFWQAWRELAYWWRLTRKEPLDGE